jgi:hypothetical protein
MRGMLQRRFRLLVSAALALSALGLATAAWAGASFSDTAGDNSVAIDIASVTVTEAEGNVVTTVTVANPGMITPQSRIDLWFDLDSNPRTGDEGDEALARYAGAGTVTFHRWNGSELVRRPAARVTATLDAQTLTYTVAKAALDNEPIFGVLVVAWGMGETDDGDDVFGYDAVPERARIPYVSPGPATLSDPIGDVASTPDVARVGVTDSKDGTIRFTVGMRGDATLPPSGQVEVLLDRDLLGESSAIERADLQLEYGRRGLQVWRWNEFEEEWVRDRSPQARVRRLGKGVLVFEVHRSELDDVARFGFNVVSSVLDEDEDYAAWDIAPDSSAWRYTLAHRPPLRLIADGVSGAPERPLAGRPFTISLPVRRSDTSRGLTSGKVDCTIAAGGRTLKASGEISRGTASCTVRVPRNAVVVRGSMVVRALGKSVTAWFAGAIGFGGGTD